MRIAYLISAHNDVQHLKRLIEALHSDADFFVHIDAKVDITPFKEAIEHPHVHFIEKRYDIMWGSFMQVKYQMALIEKALSSSVKYDYLLSLSGLDYPVWSNERITKHLESNNGKEYIYATCLAMKPRCQTKLYREYRFLNNHSWKYGTIKSKFRVALRHIVSAIGMHKELNVPMNGTMIPLYKGGSWWGITTALAERILEIYNNCSEYVNYFRNSFAPDETFIHTIAMNSNFASRCTLVQNAERLEELSPLTYIEYGKEIKVLTEDDYDNIVSSDKMFCRKTISGKSNGLLNIIDKIRKE